MSSFGGSWRRLNETPMSAIDMDYGRGRLLGLLGEESAGMNGFSRIDDLSGLIEDHSELFCVGVPGGSERLPNPEESPRISMSWL